MSDRQLTEISNQIEWNIVARRSLEGQLDGKAFFIPAQRFSIDAYVAAVGLRNTKAPAHWDLGGWATPLMLFTPSEFSSDYPSAVATGSQRLKLNVLNLVLIPQILKPCILEVKFARWHARIELEVWRYDGPDVSQFDRFNDLEAKIP